MTRADHASGSDRIFEALGKVDPDGASAEIIVNLQGDLPTHRGRPISRRRLRPLADDAVDIATLAAEIKVAAERTDPNVVKVVGTPVAPARLRALYFTRATAPAGEGPLYHHIGLYAYRRAALERFVEAAAVAAGAARKARAIARARGRHAHRRRHRRCRAARRRHAGGFGKGARHANGSFMSKGRMTKGRMTKAHDQAKQEQSAARSRSRASRAPIRTSPATQAYRGYEPLPCPTFEDAFAAVRTGRAELAMIPIDNSVAGRVADIHHLMPASGLHIVGGMVPAGAAPAHGAARRDASKPSRRSRATSMRSGNAATSSASSASRRWSPPTPRARRAKSPKPATFRARRWRPRSRRRSTACKS